jgi:hypothetical protein
VVKKTDGDESILEYGIKLLWFPINVFFNLAFFFN